MASESHPAHVDTETAPQPSLENHSRRPFAIGLRLRQTSRSQSSRRRLAQRYTSVKFAGRLGGNQEFVVDRHDDENEHIVKEDPDAAVGMSLREQFDLKGFTRVGLWKAGIMEGVGTLLLVYLTAFANASPDVIPTRPTSQLGYFDNAAYLGPTTGGLINFILLTLFTFIFGVTTGAHLNPTITLATFFARLTTLPRMLIYIAFQVFGASLAGYLVRTGLGTRDFKVGGCWFFDSVVPVADAFSIEFVSCTALLFMAFGVGLDPRQQKVIPPALAPFLVGLTLGVVSWSTGYARYGYGGASMNPARCFGTAVGSHFKGWEWHYWVAAICASIFHSICYSLIPPGKAAYS